MKSIRTLLAVMTGATVVLALSAAGAQACTYTGAAQVFSPWGDQHSYVLAPDGGFENGGQGWALSGGAAAMIGNESFNLNGVGDSRSLSLPAGSTAVSPSICMSLDTPIIRLVARNRGNPSSGLRVEASYSLLGLVRTKAVSTVYAGSEWAPSQQLSTVLSLATVVGTLVPSAIQVHLTPLGQGGSWQVDDLYVDPFARY